jgi:hypothetical protein
VVIGTALIAVGIQWLPRPDLRSFWRNTMNSPCKNCVERFPACSDKCPKDLRGEYGYKAWYADYKKVQNAEKEYKRKRREDFLMSEQCRSAREDFARKKSRRRRGKNNA